MLRPVFGFPWTLTNLNSKTIVRFLSCTFYYYIARFETFTERRNHKVKTVISSNNASISKMWLTENNKMIHSQFRCKIQFDQMYGYIKEQFPAHFICLWIASEKVFPLQHSIFMSIKNAHRSRIWVFQNVFNFIFFSITQDWRESILLRLFPSRNRFCLFVFSTHRSAQIQ